MCGFTRAFGGGTLVLCFVGLLGLGGGSCGPVRGGDGGGPGGDGAAGPGGDGAAGPGGDGHVAGGDGGPEAPRCGNAVVEAAEACDGADLAGSTCTSLASVFTGGTLSCATDCTFDTTACVATPYPTGTHDFNADGFADFVAGTPWEGSSPTGEGPGGARIYLGGPGLVSGVAPAGVVAGLAPYQTAGQWVAAAGDVDGDGYDDVLVSSHVLLAPDVTRLYRGDAGFAFDGTADATLAPATSTYSTFQMSCAGAGDLNGDGDDDVVLGYWPEDTAWVFLGGPGGPGATPAAVLDTTCSGGMGIAVAGAGDVNGDGFDDVLVGGPGGAGTCNAGIACLWFGGPGATFDDAADGVIVYDCPGGGFADSISSAGDLDGDGFDDVVIGQPGTGLVSVYRGGAGLSFNPAVDASILVPPLERMTVASAGDLNGDGFDDLAVGSPGDWMTGDPGHVYVYFGGPGDLAVLPAAVLTGAVANSGFGRGLASPGDVDGDGFADLVVGAPAGAPAQVFVYLGGPGPSLDATADVVLDGAGYDGFGLHID